MKQETVQDLNVLGHFAKTDVRYSQETIFRQTYMRNGETLATKNWAMKIAHPSRRETFPLGIPNKAAAAAKVRTSISHWWRMTGKSPEGAFVQL